MDEAGDEGFRFGKGSSDWFVLSSVIIPKAVDLEVVKLVDVVRQNVFKRKDQSPLHLRDLKHAQRIPFLDHLARARLHTLAILMHKPSLTALEQEKLKVKDAVYFVCLGLLFEALCEYSREKHPDNPYVVEVTLSHRSRMSNTDITQFLEQLQLNPRLPIGHSVSIDNAIIQPKHINVESPKKWGYNSQTQSLVVFSLGCNLTNMAFQKTVTLKPCVHHSALRWLRLAPCPHTSHHHDKNT